jgi:putative ABC transport system substrate-binding protein
MKRRELLFLLGGAAAIWPFAAHAQQKAMPVIGFLSPRTFDPSSDPGFAPFRRGLRELGYVEGQNIVIAFRSADGDYQRLPALAAELAALKPDVIVTNGTPAIQAAKDAGGAIPIVMSVVGDPVAAGFAQSLAHPGGNLTGLTNLSEGLVGKRLQLLLETAPNPGCVAALRDSGSEVLDALAWQELTAAAQPC